jgi:hypothetical protein
MKVYWQRRKSEEKSCYLKVVIFFRRKHWGFGEFFQACFAAGSHKFDLYRQCTYLVFIRQAHVNNNSPILLKKKQKYMSFQSTSALWCCNFIPFVRRFVFIHWTNKAKNSRHHILLKCLHQPVIWALIYINLYTIGVYNLSRV